MIVFSILTTFFFGKFISHNGLHDEYQHHAVVEDMIKSKKWPIRDELRYNIDISTYYHYGWYHLVIFIKFIFSVSIEDALDIAKLILFIPVIPLFYNLLCKFLRINWQESIFISLLLMFQGPALFFLDNYTSNVFLHGNNNIIYQPLFFQLAGITWFGSILMISYLSILYELLLSQKIKLFVAIFFSLAWSLFLLNKVYLLIYLFLFITMFIFIRSKYIKIYFGSLFVGVILALILNYFNFINIIKSTNNFGFPFFDSTGLKFQPFFSINFIKSFGILPLLSFALIIYSLFKQKQRLLLTLIFLIWFYLWSIPYLINLNGSELVFNKFYILALWVSLIIVINYTLSKKYKIKLIIYSLLMTSIVAPIFYFSSLSLKNIQIYWDYHDEIINYLQTQNKLVTINIKHSDLEYAKYLINNLDVQLIFKQNNKAEYDITKIVDSEKEFITKTKDYYLYKN